MFTCVGYATSSADKPLQPLSFQRRDPGPTDVRIDIQYCGVCHSDLHQARNEWRNTVYPCLPGHEIVGRVSAVGAEVSKFKVGDLAGVGCLVDSCQDCPACAEGLENYCEKGQTFTYNSPDKDTDHPTFGGYSQAIVVTEDFCLKIPANLDPKGVAPLLCAGITTYSPLRHWKIGPGMRVGIVGLGGLGHMGLKLAHAMGATVALFTTSAGKADDARKLGADEVIISKDPAAMAAQANSFDFILDTVAAAHDINALLACLKRDATLCQVGAPDRPLDTNVFGLIFKRRNFAGSLIGGIPETQEMLDFCADHGIVSDIEVIRIDQINDAYERMLRSDGRYRFVIDMATLKA